MIVNILSIGLILLFIALLGYCDGLAFVSMELVISYLLKS